MSRLPARIVLGLAGPLAALAAVWYVPIAHYGTGPSSVSAAVVERARAPLAQEVRALMDGRDFDVPVRAPLGQAADRVRRLRETGDLQLGDFPPVPVKLPFDPANLERGGPGWQLQIVSLAVPRLFLDAYRETGERANLVLARNAILGWARYEGSRWLPQGMLWNDHAVAARIRVLADFWQAYREHPDLMGTDQAGTVLAFAARGIALTARPGQYNPRTNHGILQDLALWHAHLAFPGLPAAEPAARLARERFAGHLPYYLGPEGVVLEHSAGYHAVGVKLVGRAFRYMALSGQAIPPEWWRRYRGAVRFLQLLRRPDGTLPRIGDTGIREAAGLRVARAQGGGVRLVPLGPPEAPAHTSALFPVAGYWVGWRGAGQGGAAQTVLAWSRFAGHGHKHADELSLLFWADGVDWWTAAGYWPYGARGRTAAAGWTGANAPHLAGEPPSLGRTSRLLGHAEGRLRFLDLERRVPSRGYRVQRQLISLAGGTWAVLDSADGGGGGVTEEVWRTGPGVAVAATGSGGFRLAHAASPVGLSLWHVGSGRVRWVRGGEGRGVRGLVAAGRRPVATRSLILERPSGGEPSLLAWRLGAGGPGPRLLRWQGPEHWKLRLPGDRGPVTVTRTGRLLRYRAADGAAREIALTAPPAVQVQRAAMARQMAAMRQEYGTFRPLLPYRERMTAVVGVLAVAHLGLFTLMSRRRGRGRSPALLALSGWLVFAGWLNLYYFRF